MSDLPLGSPDRPLRVAVVGAGPAGFYACDALVKREAPAVSVDLFERLPAPYGLVRYGVAPDHQKIKSVIRAYEKTLQHPRVRLLANVHVCEGHISAGELLAHYDQVVFTVGCETDKRLGIPGEDLSGSHAATSFVAWYNGHPSFDAYSAELRTERAAVVGVGDVALDITRMLVKSGDELAPTDVADGALSIFRQSTVREVLVIARRGPGQVSFATKELEDIVDLPDVDVLVDPADIAAAQETKGALDGLAARKLSYLASLSERPRKQAKRTVRFLFLRSPTQILGTDGRVTGLELEKNRLSLGREGEVRADATGERHVVDVGLVFRSVGYRGVALEGVPFDARQGLMPNDGGRVLLEGAHWPRVYCAGWIKRGPTGVIGTNKSDAADTVARMLEDVPGLARDDEALRTPLAVDRLLAERGVRVVSFADWKRLDDLEVSAGQQEGRVRKKLTRVSDMLDALGR